MVHGGSARTNQVAEQLGYPPRFVTTESGYTSRYTDRTMLTIFEMVYCGEMNKGWVERLQQRGVNAVGISGMDGRTWEGVRKKTIRIVDESGRRMILRDDYTGRVEKVNAALIRSLLDAGYTPVITPPAISYEGEAINVDGDRAAAATAIAMGSQSLVIISNVPGLLENFPDEESLIESITKDELDGFMSVAQTRMKKKVMGASEALKGGVQKVFFGDGRYASSITNAMKGSGTSIA